MVFDTFCFFNEIELLKIRLEYLYEHVDRFVICESTVTHSGSDKPLYLKENLAAFSRWADKLELLNFVPDVKGLRLDVRPTSYDPASDHWKIETAQRDYLMTALGGVNQKDWIFVSDVDEIWNRDTPKILTHNENSNPVLRLLMAHFCYFLNCRKVARPPHQFSWKHPFVVRGDKINGQTSLSMMRVRGEYPVLNGINSEWAGWHFTSMGGAGRVRDKILAYAHQEANTPKMRDLSYLDDCISKGVNPFQDESDWCELMFVPMNYFPQELREILIKHTDWIKYSLN